MARLQLSLAIGEYDHVRDLLEGKVRPEGIDLVACSPPIEEIFFRFFRHREWHVSEMSFAKVASLASQDDRSLVALPVFPSRVFRHSSIYVRAGAGIARPEDLAGRRLGVPEWAQTAAVYSRGLLAHEYGIDLRSIHWHQAGVNQPGRAEKVALKLPQGLRCAGIPGRSLSELLLSGELDAVLSARPPAPFLAGDARVQRLFPDAKAVELAYCRKTGIFPIMHVVVMRREVYERDRWIAMSLFKAFDAARTRSLARLDEATASFYPLPWVPEHARQARELLGEDPFPYGVEPNRATLKAFLRDACEQGVCHRHLAPEELFAPETLERYRI